MKYLPAILGRGLCFLALAAATFLPAADKPDTKQTASKAVPEPNVAAAWQRRIPEMVVDNLPLGEIILELRHQFPEINFLVRPSGNPEFNVEGVTVKMVLRSVTLPEILKALEVAADRPIEITGGSDERLVVFTAKTPPVPIDASGLPLVSPVQTRVFNLSGYLSARSDKEAAAAMQELENVLHTAGDMLTSAGNGERRFRPRLNLHRGTKLLIAVGRPDELSIVEQVVTELQRPFGQFTIPERPARTNQLVPGGPPSERRP